MVEFILKGIGLGVSMGFSLYLLSNWWGAYRSALRICE